MKICERNYQHLITECPDFHPPEHNGERAEPFSRRPGKTTAFIVELQKELTTLRSAAQVAADALEHTNKFCLCNRSHTKGFDYGEEHKYQGKPGIGKRWITPKDSARIALDELASAGVRPVGK